MRERNISIDCYRVLCMFLITTIHIVGYSDLINHITSNAFNFYFIIFIKVLQVFSISGFTMISSYFLIEKTSTSKKIVSFIFQLIFYSIIIFLLSLVFISKNISAKIILKSFFPILCNHYWYPINYIFLLILIPGLNKAFKVFNKKEQLSIIIVFAAIISFFFHINPFFDPTVFVGHHTHSLIHFVLLYLISAYIKLNGIKRPKIFGYGMFFVSGLILYILFLIQNHGLGGIIDKYSFIKVFLEKVNLLSYNSILSILFTTSSFIIFTQIKIPSTKLLSKLITAVIPATFAIYLIQEHDAVRNYLWSLINITKWADSYWLIPIMILIFIVLFGIAFLLHILYQIANTFLITRIELKMYNLINKCKCGLCKIKKSE